MDAQLHTNYYCACNFRVLAQYLKRLERKPSEYLSYFWWRDHYTITRFHDHARNSLHKLCSVVHDGLEPPRVIPDIDRWYNEVD